MVFFDFFSNLSEIVICGLYYFIEILVYRYCVINFFLFILNINVLYLFMYIDVVIL